MEDSVVATCGYLRSCHILQSHSTSKACPICKHRHRTTSAFSRSCNDYSVTCKLRPETGTRKRSSHDSRVSCPWIQARSSRWQLLHASALKAARPLHNIHSIYSPVSCHHWQTLICGSINDHADEATVICDVNCLLWDCSALIWRVVNASLFPVYHRIQIWLGIPINNIKSNRQ